MIFGEAIEDLKCGRRIYRPSWDKKKHSSFVELGSNISYLNSFGETINPENEKTGDITFVYVGTQCTQFGWQPSADDMLAEDWRSIDRYGNVNM